VVPAERRGRAVAERLAVVPSLWAPFHHRPAVATLAAFAEALQPGGIVFMNAPGAPSTQEAREAFLNVLAAFRATYRGPIAAHMPTDQEHAAAFTRLNVATLPESSLIVPGWRAASIDLNAQPDIAAHAATADTNIISGATGRLRLTGRAAPTADGTIRAWLVFECGTLAADSGAGTLGFGILEMHETTVTARPMRIGADGSFTYRGIRYKPS
jgi:hypothetical protein